MPIPQLSAHAFKPPAFRPASEILGANADAAQAASAPVASAPVANAPIAFVKASEIEARRTAQAADLYEVPGAAKVSGDVVDQLDAQLDRAAPAPAVVASDEPVALDRPVLLFNDQCEVCKAISAWVKKSDASGKDLIDERPIGDDPEALKKLNPSLDIWDVYTEIHLLMPDGRVLKGGDAVGEVLKRLPQLKWATWALDVGVGGFKPFQLALNGAYKLLDAIRPALGCSSCGGGPVVWWAKPIKWTADAVKAVKRAFTGDAPAPA